MKTPRARLALRWPALLCVPALMLALWAARSEAAPSKVDMANYTVEIKPIGVYSAGREGMVEIVLVTKGDYTINDKYPFRFKAADPPAEGITYPKPALVRSDGVFTDKTGTFRLPFVAAKAGRHTIGGTLSLSIVNLNAAIMDKVTLEIAVEVK